MEIKLSSNIPSHVAIIMDGNGRWANKKGLPRTSGHKAGLENLGSIAKFANELGIKELSVFAFSTENFNRPTDEINFLMNLPKQYLKEKNNTETNIKINFIGFTDRIPSDTLEAIKKITDKTKDNDGMILNVCFNYGGKQDIVNAVNKTIESGKKVTVDSITENLLVKNPIDLLIRTSGEIRVSNYMLWQMAYSEMYFTDTYWPDFNEECLLKAIEAYQKRDRRFGNV